MKADTAPLEKIRSLLALGHHESANKHEAEIALIHARKLLIRYNLEEQDVLDDMAEEPLPDIHELLIHVPNNRTWMRILGHEIAEHFLCNSLISIHTTPTAKSLMYEDKRWQKKKVYIQFVGREENVKIASEVYEWVVGQLDQLATAATARVQLEYHQTKQHWRNSFLQGLVHGICSRLEEQRQRDNQETQALVVSHQQEISDHMKAKYPDITEGHSKQATVDGLATRMGQAASAHVSLTPPSQQVSDDG